MELTAHGRSDVGRVRTGNEDRYLVDVTGGLFAVSDGMGGHQAGEVAASLAIETLSTSWRKRAGSLEGLTDSDLSNALLLAAEEAMLEVCGAVYAEATARTGHAGMGATLTFVAVVGELAVMGHVGDTRLYLIRDGEAHQLSADHTLAEELVASGVLDAKAARSSSHAGVLTRSLGSQRAVKVDRLIFEVDPGDILILCSDGLTRYAPTASWIAQQTEAATAEALTDRLVAHANESGGEDNVSVVVVRIPAEQESVTSDVRHRISALTKVPFLSDLGLPHRARLAQAAELRRLAPAEALVSAGEDWSSLIVVHTGSLSVLANGKAMRELPAGEYAGLRHIVRPGVAAFGLVASQDSEVVVLGHDAFMYELHLRTWLGTHVLEQLSAELAAVAHPETASSTPTVLLP